jgi:hypothetical protein
MRVTIKATASAACNGTPFVLDTRVTSAFFASRPYLFSQIALAGAQSLYQWDDNADPQFGEVDGNTGNTYLSYWVDYDLAHLFAQPPGADILVVHNNNSGALEALATRNDDGSVVVLLADHHVRSLNDNNRTSVPHTVNLDVSAGRIFHRHRNHPRRPNRSLERSGAATSSAGGAHADRFQRIRCDVFCD